MKASDISDEEFTAALEPDGYPTMIWDLERRLGFPRKVVLAKARTMIERRKTVDGCPCGCRGDFVLIEEQQARWNHGPSSMDLLREMTRTWLGSQ